MTLPRDAHWGGKWVVRERGIYYVNQHSTAAGTGIELLPFRPAARARPIRILPLAAPPSGSAPFTIAPDESWLAWSQEDHRAACPEHSPAANFGVRMRTVWPVSRHQNELRSHVP